MKISLALTILFMSIASQASQKAVTDEGDIVILNDDGTWAYESPDTVESVNVLTNEAVFEKSKNSSFRVKSQTNDTEIWLDPKKWSFKKGGVSEDAEYSFQLKGEDVYGMLIAEQVQLGMVALSNIALENARNAAPGMRIVKREFRTVNGVTAIYMEMQGSMQGGEFTFLGYYFSNESGSTQFLAYTGSRLVEKYDAEIRLFLNGFSSQ